MYTVQPPMLKCDAQALIDFHSSTLQAKNITMLCCPLRTGKALIILKQKRRAHQSSALPFYKPFYCSNKIDVYSQIAAY